MAEPSTGLEGPAPARRGRRSCLWVLIVIMVLSAAGYATRQAVAPCWPGDPVRTDPHAYHRDGCSSGWTNSSTDTLTGALRYYGLALPPAAGGVRYYSDDDSFNGPDTLFLHFSVGAPGLPAFLKTLAAAPAAKTPAEVTSGTSRSQSFVEGLGPDWDPTATAGSAVYQWDGASSGNVIVERGSTDTVVILVVAVAVG